MLPVLVFPFKTSSCLTISYLIRIIVPNFCTSIPECSLGQTYSAFWDIKILTITRTTIMYVRQTVLYDGALPKIIL